MKRLVALEEIIDKMKLDVRLIELGYLHREFKDKVKGLEKEKEGGERCNKCFYLRLEESAKFAKRNNFDYFTTTLSVSPYKNSQKLNEIGKMLEEKYDIKYLYSDFKKKEGYKRSNELSNKYGIYRQHYCGCEYSLKEAKALKE